MSCNSDDSPTPLPSNLQIQKEIGDERQQSSILISNMPSHIEQLSGLETRLMDYMGKSRRDSDDGFDDGFYALLSSVLEVVRNAQSSDAANLDVIVDKAGSILDGAIDWAYGDGDFDFLQSFAHSNSAPLVKDTAPQPIGDGCSFSRVLSSDMMILQGKGWLSHSSNSFNALHLVKVLDLRQRHQDIADLVPLTGLVPQGVRDKLISSPWTASPRPHPKSTRLSRFSNGLNTSATDTTPLAKVILQARCEVSSDDFPCPVNAAIAKDSSALAVVGQGGYKNRDPVLSLYILDETEDNDRGQGGNSGRDTLLGRHYRSVILEPGLSEVAYQVAMDTPHKLAFIADSYRVKSFYWGLQGEASIKGWTPTRGTNVHTLDSRSHDGPLVMLSDGRLVRAGSGSFALWDLDKLATHEGGRRVGRGKFDVDSWRDDSEEIENSTGSKPTSTIKLAGEGGTFAPATLALHEPSGFMLAGENARKTPGRYGCYALDLANDGKKVARYLGHGGFVEAFSISSGDANVFATGCSDGYARLYDVRHPTPVITLDAGKSGEFCSAVQLIHPDGVPGTFEPGSWI